MVYHCNFLSYSSFCLYTYEINRFILVSPLVVKACNASDINLKEEYHLSKFHIYVLVYCIGAFFFFFFWLTSLCIIGSSFIHLIRTDSSVFFLMVSGKKNRDVLIKSHFRRKEARMLVVFFFFLCTKGLLITCAFF